MTTKEDVHNYSIIKIEGPLVSCIILHGIAKQNDLHMETMVFCLFFFLDLNEIFTFILESCEFCAAGGIPIHLHPLSSVEFHDLISIALGKRQSILLLIMINTQRPSPYC